MTSFIDPSAVDFGEIASLVTPDVLTRDQWAYRYGARNTWIKDPNLRLAIEGVLWQCVSDLKLSKPGERLRCIESIRWWLSPEGERDAIYKFSVCIEAIETIIGELNIDRVRERILGRCDEAEQDALKKLGGANGEIARNDIEAVESGLIKCW